MVKLDAVAGMWFDRSVHTSITTRFAAGLILALTWLIQATAVWGAAPSGVELPDGERLLDLAWSDDAHLFLVVDSPEGYAIRWLEVATGEMAVVPVPRSFSRIEESPEEDLAVEFYLAPSGAALAVLERTSNPLIINELSVYTLSPAGLESVDTHLVPRKFWPGLVAWEPQGLFLYLAAVEYIHPEQEYSIGRLEISSGNFENMVLKANVDLIDQLVYIPQRHALAVNCRSFHGEYPEVAMTVLIESGAAATILHSQASGLRLRALANGQLFLQAGRDAPPGSNPEQWVLDVGADTLRLLDSTERDAAIQLQSSPRGNWLGYLASAQALGMPGAADSLHLALHQPSTGAGFSTDAPCVAFVFAPGETLVCTVDADGTGLQFYDLPD